MAPLSEHEKRQLRLLEEQLHAEDPKFVKTMRSKRLNSFWHPSSHHSILFNFAGVVLGIAMFLSGLGMQNIFVAVLGFVIVLMSAYWMPTMRKSATSGQRPKTKSAFMANLEYQWDERKRNEL